MCGISGGMSHPLNMYEMGIIKSLMLLSCLRGMSGSGAIVVRPVNKKLKIDIHKTELCAAELAVDEEFSESTKSPRIVISHARAPTRGGESIDFVHPHRVNHLTGVHNGTMNTVMKDIVKKEQSDSREIFKAISEHGVEEFLKNSRGAYSLVWVDAKDGTLNFLRNDQRPMVFARIGLTDHATTMYFSSEKGMLDYVLSQRGSTTTDSIKYVSPKPFEHVRFSLDCRSGLLPLSLKQYEEPFKVSTTGYNRKIWGYEWEENIESPEGCTTNKTGQGVSPLRLSPPTTDTTSTTSSRSSPYQGTVRGQQMPFENARFLPTVQEILNRRNAPSVTFPDNENIALIRAGECVVCETRPSITGVKIPKIYPIKFGDTGNRQYICDECVQKKNPIALSVLGARLETTH